MLFIHNTFFLFVINFDKLFDKKMNKNDKMNKIIINFIGKFFYIILKEIH